MLCAVNPASQSVAVNQPVLFASNRIMSGATCHEAGSGSVILTKPGVYRITFEGNVSTATAGNIILAINANGEALPSAQVNLTAATDTLYTISRSTYVRVCGCGSVRVNLVNASANAVTIQDAEVLAERLC